MKFIKSNLRLIITLLCLIFTFFLNYIKCCYLNSEINLMLFCVESLLLILLSLFSNLFFKKNNFCKNYINIILITMSLLNLIFNSFNLLGMLILFSFILLITMLFKTKTKLNFEISLVFSVSCLILFFIIFGLIGLLKYSKILILIILIFSIYNLMRNKEDLKEQIKNINKTSLIIFSFLFLISILIGAGRYVHKWDEYSYWGYAAKVLINTDSYKMMVSSVSSMYNYPPVSSIWHYIVSIFLGYSEPNLYIGLSLLTFIYMMPVFMYCKKKGILFNLLFIISSVCFPLLFDGSISYGLLYVDLLLGVMCACVLILKDYLEKNKINNKKITSIILIIITLLKPNGFVFSSVILFLFWLHDLTELKKITLKSIFNSVKKYAIFVFGFLLIYGIWLLFSKTISEDSYGYMFKLLPDTLKSDIIPKLNPEFILNFFNSVMRTFDETILYSFINIPLFVFLGVVFALIVYLTGKNENDRFKKFVIYILFYLTFLLVTAISLFVMFSYYEASKLASFTRYLAPINIALILFVFYLIVKSKEKCSYVFFVVTVLLIGFSKSTFFATNINERLEIIGINNNRTQLFSIVNENTEKDAKVYVLNQNDDDGGIMPIWYARFYCYPRIVNASSAAISWKVKTESNEWDLQEWGLNRDTFVEHLIDYGFDYLFLYSKSDELYEELSILFEDAVEAKEYSLFKIEKNNKNIKFRPIK